MFSTTLSGHMGGRLVSVELGTNKHKELMSGDIGNTVFLKDTVFIHLEQFWWFKTFPPLVSTEKYPLSCRYGRKYKHNKMLGQIH